MAKKVRQFFSEKNRATPSVAAPGNTNPSDATEADLHYIRHILHYITHGHYCTTRSLMTSRTYILSSGTASCNLLTVFVRWRSFLLWV